MFSRIKLESSNYKNHLETVSELLSGFRELFEVVLDKDLSKKDYEHKRELFIRHREKIKENENEYRNLKERYMKALDKLVELETLYKKAVDGNKVVPK